MLVGITAGSKFINKLRRLKMQEITLDNLHQDRYFTIATINSFNNWNYADQEEVL